MFIFNTFKGKVAVLLLLIFNVCWGSPPEESLQEKMSIGEELLQSETIEVKLPEDGTREHKQLFGDQKAFGFVTPAGKGSRKKFFSYWSDH